MNTPFGLLLLSVWFIVGRTQQPIYNLFTFSPSSEQFFIENGPCNTQVGTVSTSEMKQSVRLLLNYTLGSKYSSFLGLMNVLVSSGIKHNLTAWKVCGLCSEFQPLVDQPYCHPSVYGYNASHSAIIFVPSENGQMIQGKFRGSVGCHYTYVDVARAPSVAWPPNVQAVLDAIQTEEDLVAFLSVHETLQVALTASSGAIGIAPDYLGYGETQATHNRTYLLAPSYQQAGAVTWLATQQLVQQQSSGCTLLDVVATVSGGSEGGGAAVEVSVVLRALGVQILRTFSLTPILDAETLMAWTYESYRSDLIHPDKGNYFFYEAAPLAFYTYTVTPGVKCVEEGQPALNPEWTMPGNASRDVISWLSGPTPLGRNQLRQRLPKYLPVLMHPALVALFERARSVNDTRPCLSSQVDNSTNFLCESVIASSVWRLFPLLDFNTTLCYSPNDTLTPPLQYPDKLFENPYVLRYQGPLASLPIQGDHFESYMLCYFSVIEYFGGRNHGAQQQQPNLVLDLDETEQLLCASPHASPTLLIMPSSSACTIRSTLHFGGGGSLGLAFMSVAMFVLFTREVVRAFLL